MKFLNRENEIKRLKKALESSNAKLIVLYGRRRCGKSTLIKQMLKPVDIYFMAQQADETVQRAQMAKTIGEKMKGFDMVVYPDWESLFVNLNNNITDMLTLCIDELPYLIKSSPQLPSVIQKIVDNPINRKYHLVLCGSSQQMMQGMVLDSTSPLYGRANEIMKITPLEAGWIGEALNCDPRQAVAEYSIWGGVPRYWELRLEEKSFEAAVKINILDRLGILHEEPMRLFLDDMRESVQAFSILSVIGNGSNRLSEIAGRLNKPATQLSRPIDNLIQLGYLKREVPFGESEKSSKKSMYRIADPFMNFFFRFIVPNLSRLELGRNDQVYALFENRMSIYIAAEWENLSRRCIPMKPIKGIEFDIAFRWWGNNLHGKPMEMDIIAESTDKKYLLAGECKWSEISDTQTMLNNLEQKARLLPFVKEKQIVPLLCIKSATDNKEKSPDIFLPEDVLLRLK